MPLVNHCLEVKLNIPYGVTVIGAISPSSMIRKRIDAIKLLSGSR